MPDRGRAPDLDALVEEVFEDHVHRGPGCWAARLDDEGRAFVAAIEDGIRRGQRPVYTKVARILAERWGIRRGSNVVSRHFRGLCDCPKEGR